MMPNTGQDSLKINLRTLTSKSTGPNGLMKMRKKLPSQLVRIGMPIT